MAMSHDAYGNLYLLTDYRALLKSPDYGVTWVTLNPLSATINRRKNEFEVARFGEDHFYAGGVYFYTGSITANEVLSVGGSGFDGIHDDIRCLQIVNHDPTGNGNDNVIMGTDGGVTYYENGSSTQLNLNGVFFPITQFYGFDVSNKQVQRIIGGTQDNATFSLIDNVSQNLCYSDGGDVIMDDSNFPKALALYGCCPTVYLSEIDVNSSNPVVACSSIHTWGSDSKLGRHFWQPESDPSQVWYAGRKYVHHSTDGGNSFISLDPNSNDPMNNVNPSYPTGIGISESNPTTVMVAMGSPSVTCPFSKKLSITDPNSSTGWTDLSSFGGNTDPVLCQALKDYMIVGIEFHPEDENQIWVCLNGVNINATPGAGHSRILYSSDRGQTWTDHSLGLPPLPMKDLLFQKGTDDPRLFVATEVGVYVNNEADNPNRAWECMNNGLPVTVVTELNFNYCTQELFASTFGRGFWKVDLPTNSFVERLNSSTPITISGIQHYYSDVVIESGTEVVVTGTIFMPVGTTITVEPGATLTIDGGTITNECGIFWEGILVEGDASLTQNTPGAMARLEVLNGGEISYAKNAVRLIGIDGNGNLDWTKTGGVVLANGGRFINNYLSCAFMSYHRIVGNGSEHRNLSQVVNCTFETNSTFPQNEFPYAHISLYDVKGVVIRGNSFSNTDFASYSPQDRGIGVVSMDASYTVSGLCPPSVPDCFGPSSANIFNDLYYGVMALQGSSSAKVNIERNQFNNCLAGVGLFSDNYGSVVRNGFNFGLNSLGQSGVLALSSNGFDIKGNIFNDPNGNAIQTSPNAGIHVGNSNISTSQIIGNDFVTPIVGIETNDDNSLLLYDCNNFTFGGGTQAAHHHATGSIANQGFCSLFQATSAQANQYYGACNNTDNVQVAIGLPANSFQL